ncbi:hypothetical protein H5L10_003999 [Escherichia coli]|nr:hypothetical protein [Escherichia coli]
MKLKYLSCMILASLAMGAFAATAADNNSAIYFNTGSAWKTENIPR